MPQPVDPDTTCQQRRAVLRQAGLLAALAGCGLPVLAADAAPLVWAPGTIDQSLQALQALPASAAQLRLSVAEVADDGAFVPVTVDSTLAGATEIIIVVDANPDPVVVRFALPPGTEPFVAIRIKMAESGHVCALLRANGQLYAAYRRTDVRVGGCG